MKERYYLRYSQTGERVLHRNGYVHAFDSPDHAAGSSRALREYYGIETYVCPIVCDTNYLPLTAEEREILASLNEESDRFVGGDVSTKAVKTQKVVKAPKLTTVAKRRIRIRKE